MRAKNQAALAILILAALSPLRAIFAQEPQTFVYTATWSGGDFEPASIQRLPLPDLRYRALKDSFIDQFVKGAQSAGTTAPGAAPAQQIDTGARGQIGGRGGRGAGGRGGGRGAGAAAAAQAGNAPAADSGPQVSIRLSLVEGVSPEAAQLVLEFPAQPVQAAITAGNDPRTLAEWAFYYWQFSLWELYVSKETLGLPGRMTVDDAQKATAKLLAPREPIWRWSEENNSKGEPASWDLANREFEGPVTISDSSRAAQAALALRFAELGGVAGAPQEPANHAQESLGMIQLFQDAATAKQAETHDRYFGLLNKLRMRQNSRERYDSWLEDRKKQVIEFAKDWNKKYEGVEYDVDGVLFMINQLGSPTAAAPGTEASGRSIAVDRAGVITPYDLINPDGTVKKPPKAED